MRRRISLLALLLLVAPAVWAQTYDDFGGLVTYQDGHQAPIAPNPADTQNATCSQSGTTQTCTVTDGTKFAVGERMIIFGTGTAMDWTFSGINTASNITACAANAQGQCTSNTLTLTASNSATVSATAGKIKPDRFYAPGTLSNNVVGIVTPEGHWFQTQTVADACANGGICTITGWLAKYGSNCTGAADEINIFKAYGWNALGPFIDANYLNCAAFPYVWENASSAHASANNGGYITQPIKNMWQGMNRFDCSLPVPMMDYYDARWQTYINTELAPAVQGTFFENPGLVGLAIDDNTVIVELATPSPDFNTSYAGKQGCHAGALVAITDPHQTANNNPQYGGDHPAPYVYNDDKVYSKTLSGSPPASCWSQASPSTPPCSWPDFLYVRYGGSISALNTAWNTSSFYTTFGSSETVVTNETFGTGDGTTLTFNHTFTQTDITAGSVHILLGGSPIGGECPWYWPGCSSSSGTGQFIGTNISSGSVTYATGVATITFATGHAPGNGVSIQGTYAVKGWGTSNGGTGIMDEDGRHTTWIGSGDGTYRCRVPKPAWQSGHAYNVNDIIQDATSQSQQIVAVAGTSGGSTPTFSSTVGNTVTDGGATWHSLGAVVCGTGSMSGLGTPNANATFAQDVDDWLMQYAAQYFSTVRTAIKTSYPHLLYFGVDNCSAYGTPCRIPVLKAAAKYVDVLYPELNEELSSGLHGASDIRDSYMYETQFFTGPIFTYENIATSDFPSGCGADNVTCATNANRGQMWYNLNNFQHTALSYNGTKQFAGMEWNGSHPFQGVAWGFITILDNPFNGHDDVTSIVNCAINTSLNCGGEAGNYGTMFGAGQTADAGNALWTLDPGNGASGVTIPQGATIVTGVVVR